MAKKTTTFIGYIGGDCECFCLHKESSAEFDERLKKIPSPDNKEAFEKWIEEEDVYSLYPNDFFPKECRQGKWKFKITIEAIKIEDK